MKRYELIIIWATGERATHLYNTYADALETERGFKMAFGYQIDFMCINEVTI